MVMLRGSLVGIAVGLLALGISLSPPPASASLEAELSIRQELVVPSQINVNTVIKDTTVPQFRVGVFTTNAASSEDPAPIVRSYKLTGPADCNSFSFSSETSISVGGEKGFFPPVNLFCTGTGLKQFTSEAEIQPREGFTDPHPDDNVSILTFFVDVVSPVINVTIDIKPGSDPNSIKLGDTGNVPVAIFSTVEFDATSIDVSTLQLNSAAVRLVGGKKVLASIEDVNNDGLADLVVKFDRGSLEDLVVGDGIGTVTGSTLDGQSILGTDSIRVIE